MNPTLRRAFGAVAAGVALTGSIAISPLAAGAETSTESVAASATIARTDAENGRVVRAMYLGFLKREPSATELTAGKALAADGDLDGLVSLVSRGDEWLGVFVDDLYDQALERTPDAEGRTYWIGELGDDKPSTLIAASVIGSPEFRQKAGGTDEKFLERAYDRILDRTPEEAGLTYWLGILQSTGDDKIGAEFFESQENRNRRVTNQYQQLLCRTPDTAGRDYWAEVIIGGRDVALSEFLATSDEFINNAVAGNCLATITEPDPDPDPDPDPETDPVPAEVCAGVTTMPVADCETLVTIYNANGGADWVVADTRDYPATWIEEADPCDWAGVECTDSKITALSLNAAGATGALDASVAELTDLVTLNVSGNSLTSLPTAFAGMTALRFVNISYNDISTVGDLTSATGINVLTATQAGLDEGSLDLSAITELQELYINNNPGSTDGAKNSFTTLPLPTNTDSLTDLEAQYNGIFSIDGVEAQTTLTHLWLFNNKIASVPAGIEALVNITADPTPTDATDNAGNDFRLGPQCVTTGASAADAAGDTYLDGRDGGPADDENWKSVATGDAACAFGEIAPA